jgi:hypothetical protein
VVSGAQGSAGFSAPSALCLHCPVTSREANGVANTFDKLSAGLVERFLEVASIGFPR